MSGRRDRPSRENRAAEAGETLIELLVSMVILGICGAAIIGSLMLAVDVSRMHEQQVLVRETLRSWAEAVSNTDDASFGSCSAACLAAKAPSVSGLSVSADPPRCWGGTAFDRACSASDSLKRVTLTVTGNSLALPGVSESLEVTLRRPCLEASAC